MASLRDTVKQYQEELRDGIAWIAFWRVGRSWNGDYFYLEANDALTAKDKSRLEEIRQKDPAAVMLNSYYCGYLGVDMTVDELTAGVRRHYENDYNSVADFIEAHDDTLPPEVLEEARQAAHAAGLPFHEKPYDGEDIDPYVYDGHMSMEDYDLMHKMIAQERSENRLNYSSFENDRLEVADRLKIERSIYFESGKADISALTALPLAELIRQREESAAAEQAIFEALQQQAAAWEAQAGNTLTFDKAIEYARTPAVTHTENQWQADENNNHTISNRVYQMRYHIYENTRYGKIYPVFLYADMGRSYQQSGQVRTGKNRRTGQKGFCGQGSYGKISEWAYQSLSAFIYGNFPDDTAGIRRAFQGKRAAITGLHRGGRGTTDETGTDCAGENRTGCGNLPTGRSVDRRADTAPPGNPYRADK